MFAVLVYLYAGHVNEDDDDKDKADDDDDGENDRTNQVGVMSEKNGRSCCRWCGEKKEGHCTVAAYT